MEKKDIKSLTLPALTQEMELLGQPKFRAGQIFKWLHQKQVLNFHEMSNLSLALRELCNENYYITSLKVKKRLVSRQDGTVKYLYELPDGNTVEAVLMHYHHGTTLCVSTQVGCRMGCAFCASTVGGLVRNLTAGEMLEELYAAVRDSGETVSGIVLMGIGEPLDNYDNVLAFLKILSSPEGPGMSLRHVSLSTCGLVDEIDALSREKLGLTLSVSLHAPNDRLRRETMPVAKRWPMEELLSACGRYFNRTGRRVTFEYALIDGENDGEDHARELGERLRTGAWHGMPCHVNLIPANTVSGKPFRASGSDRVRRFAAVLEEMGVTATVRRRLGADIGAACGQLRRDDATESDDNGFA